MKFIDISQNTPEWHALRRVKIGASSCAAILGVDPFRDSSDVFNEMVFGRQPFINDAMVRGSLEEPKARDYYNAFIGGNFIPKVVLSDTHNFMMASLDGIDEDRKLILEIKSPGITTLKKVKDKDLPLHWIWQIQHQLAVTDYKTAILFVWDGIEGEHILIPRDETMISTLIEEEKKFYENHILQFEPPFEPLEEKFDPQTLEAVKNYDEALSLFKKAEKSLEKAKQNLINENKSFKCGHLSVRKIIKAGPIDYKAIPELKDVNLNLYRKPASEYWRIF